MKTLNPISKSRLCPALAVFLVLVCGFIPISADSIELKLEKRLELILRVYSPPYAITGLSGLTSTETGYVLKTPYRLFFYDNDLELIRSVELKDTTSIGSRSLVVADDTLIYVLQEGGHVSQYDLEGQLLRRWRYSRNIEGKNIAVLNGKVMISGEKLHGPWDARPAFILYDTSGIFTSYEDFYPASLIELLNKEEKTMFISAQAASYKNGFAVTTSVGPEVFLFSSEGLPQGTIIDTPPGYKSLTQALVLNSKKAKTDTAYMKTWFSSWDFVTGYFGIRVLDDSLLVVPRRNAGEPYYIDIYNLNQRSFIQRLESDVRVAGASPSLLFFADTITKTYAKLSAYRIISTDTPENPPPVFQRKDCGGCGRPLSRYQYVESSEEINQINSISLGEGRLARVFSQTRFEPDSLKRFCKPEQKNMFVFYCPTHFAGELLIDTLYTYLEGRNDWMLTTVLCYDNPQELNLYLLDIPGHQILINRNVQIPDSTLLLSDIGLPPMALALSQDGEQIISGYSLGPRYDGQKKEQDMGITFREFLKECGLVEDTVGKYSG